MFKFIPVLVLFGAAGVANANLLINGSFETDVAPTTTYNIRYTGASNPTGWTQYNDGVDIYRNGYTQGPAVLLLAQDGEQFMDMNAAGQYGGLRQDVAAIPGTGYQLSFYASKWAQNSAGVLIYSLIDPVTNNVLATSTVGVTNTAGWQHLTLDGIATSSSIRVQIEATGDVFQAAPGLDNVSLVSVPEPSSTAMAGLPAVVLLSRRRR